jgi:flavin-binding protein dodecin
MWVSKHNEFIASSTESFEDAARGLVTRANLTLRGITGVEVVAKRADVSPDGTLHYRLHARVVLDVAAPEGSLHW